MRPNYRSIKINCDATWSSDSRKCGIGIIARNHVAEIVGGAHRPEISDIIDYLEALTILEGITLAVAKGWDAVNIELDAASVINHIRGIDKHW